MIIKTEYNGVEFIVSSSSAGMIKLCISISSEGSVCKNTVRTYTYIKPEEFLAIAETIKTLRGAN